MDSAWAMRHSLKYRNTCRGIDRYMSRCMTGTCLSACPGTFLRYIARHILKYRYTSRCMARYAVLVHV